MKLNEVNIEMDSNSSNESFARICVSAFVAPLNPLVSEILDIKTAVSEAVTNCIIHGYENNAGKIYINLKLINDELTVSIKDLGVGIKDISEATTPLFTSKPHLERSGLGFTVMTSFMDDVKINSSLGVGTEIVMKKKIKCDSCQE